jgi:exopolysaccharide production protein ExoQ
MGAQLALLICSLGVAGLFYLDRDQSVPNSKALWLPVIWIWIAGSRAVSVWFGDGGGSSAALASSLDGSPMDAAVFQVLIAAGILVLFLRRRRASALLKASGPLLLYFAYCMISTSWSAFHGPAFKRWIKDVGDLVMVLVIVTDPRPIAALRRLYSRIGFILLPFSVALIRYTDLGRGYDPDGGPENTGVTTNKNSLGLIVYLVSLGALWNVRALLMDKEAPNRTRRLVAQCTLLTFGVVLLQMAHSATSIACFLLGAGLMLATSLPAIRTRPNKVHALCLGIFLAGGLLMLFGGQSLVTSALGRKSNLSGRTDIWKACLNAVQNPLIGSGFESFWNTNIEKVADGLRGYWQIHNLVSAHNGYIEVYLDLGFVGLCLISMILVIGYLRAGEAFQRDPQFGSLILAYIITSAFYSITEAGFRVLAPSWIFLLLAVISANGVAAGLFGGKSARNLASAGGKAGRMLADKEFMPDKTAAYARQSGLTAIEIARADNLR